ncbi:MAG TPA: hypothetical protein VE573_07620 [Nitrososphaeraceae archaeon]|nr:hypothetical protein [Nitrososphaeraceae archaeon]
MTTRNNKDGDSNDIKPRDNIFQIMDGIIAQLNRTKKMFIIMILTLMIIPPVAFAVTFALLGPPFHFETGGRGGGSPDGFGPPPQIAVARIVPILVSLVWLGIGIRQWFVLSKWSKKYERYKELQKMVDEKLEDITDDKPKP